MNLVGEFVSNCILAGPIMYAGIAMAMTPERTSRMLVDSLSRVQTYQEQFRPALRRDRRIKDPAVLNTGVRMAGVALVMWTFLRISGILALAR